MSLKSVLRIVAIALLLGAFATLVKIPSSTEVSAPPKTELQKMLADKQYDSVLRSANDALRQNAQDFSALLAKGVALTAQNQRQEAISLYQKMIKEFPDATEPYNNLAALYASEGKYDNARQTLEKAMQTQGSYAVAYKNLNAVYAKLADQAYNKALEAGTDKSEQPLQLSLLTEQGQAGKQAFIVAMSQFEAGKQTTSSKKQPQLAKAPVEEALPPPAQIAATPSTPTTPSSTPVATTVVTQPPVTTAAPAAATQVAVANEAKSSKPTIQVAVLSTDGREGKNDRPADKSSSSTEKLSKAADKPVAKSGDKTERELIDTVQSWAAAWSKQDIKAYLAHYASNFDPGNQSRSAWESDRRARIGGKARISVGVSDFVVNLKSPTSAAVKFRQSYRSDRLNSQTGKTLVLERKGDAWRIVQEKAGG